MNKEMGWVLASVLLLAAGCQGTSADAPGGARVALSSTGPDGAVYRLESARFRIRGASSVDFATNDFPAESIHTFQLAPGDYSVTLLGGWSLVRTAGDANDGPVEAALVSANPLMFRVESGAVTGVRFTFQVNDIDIIFEPGDLELGVDIVFPDAGAPVETTCAADADCDDGLFCNAAATCSVGHPDADARGCLIGAAPCTAAGEACDELQDVCVPELACVAPLVVCSSDVDCGDDGRPCDGELRCDPSSPDAAPNGCVSVARACSLAACDPILGCQPCRVDSDCGYCDGLVCDPSSPAADASGCVPGEGPTPNEECTARWGFCWERSRGCAGFPEPERLPCATDEDCGGWCNGFICDPDRVGADYWGCVSGRPVYRNVCAALQNTPHCLESVRACGDCTEAGTVGCDADSDGILGVYQGGTDCDDSDADRFPSNLERCDGAHDEDCNPATVAGTGDGDLDDDGRVSSRCRNETTTGPNTPASVTQGDDCDDQLADVHPGATELCNHRDDDCDGVVDEGSSLPLYRDADGDGFGDASCTFAGCWNDVGFVTNASDCDDMNAALTPGTGSCLDSTRVGLCSFGEVVAVTCPGGQRCRTGVDGVGRCQ